MSNLDIKLIDMLDENIKEFMRNEKKLKMTNIQHNNLESLSVLKVEPTLREKVETEQIILNEDIKL